MATTTQAGARRIDGARAGRQYELPDGRRFPSVTSILSVISKPALVNWAARLERDLVLGAAGDLWDSMRGHDSLFKEQTRMSRLAFMESLRRRCGTSAAHQQQLKKAGDIGSETHALIEWRLKVRLGLAIEKDRPVVCPEACIAFASFEEWSDRVDFEPLRIEFMVWSSTHRYAGTLDVLGRLNLESGERVLCLGDWKTGKAIYPEAILQDAAYINALREMGHLPAEVGEVWGFICRLPKTSGDPAPEIRMVPPAEQAIALEAFLHARHLYAWQHNEKPDNEPGAAA